MKIRTDFVTNSSSSSFVTINVTSGTLATYLDQNGLKDVFKYIRKSGITLSTELSASVSQSLIAILKKVVSEWEWDARDFNQVFIGTDIDDIRELIHFIIKNKMIIDAEASCNIKLEYSCNEDGYAYFQSLVCRRHHGKLTKWPCADGWNTKEGGGYRKIQSFNSKLVDGEIQELIDLAYDTVWDILWHKDALATAIERTGTVVEFEAPQLTGNEKPIFEKDLKLDEIKPVNVDWIQDALFVFTGLTEHEESIASAIVEDNDGIVKYNVLLKTNYVIYNPYCEYETNILKRAKELIEKGKKIQLLTVSDFCKKLITNESGEAVTTTDKKATPVPTTMKECRMIFKCSTSKNRVVIQGLKKSATEVIIPGVIDGMPVEVEIGAFNKINRLEKVTFAEGVEAIGSNNFNDCKSLKEVVFASTIKKLGTGLFKNTPWISKQGDWLVVNGILVKYLGNATEVRIPDGITCINDFAFAWNGSIRTLVIPESVSYIGNSACLSCTYLKDIQFPKKQIGFGTGPFNDTAWAKSQNLPENPEL